MSSRGLLQSGIWLEMENRLNTGQLTAEQQLLATRLSDLQNQLNQALMGFGNMRINATQQFDLAKAEAIQGEAERKANALQQGLATAIDLYDRNRQYSLDEFSTKAPYYIDKYAEAADRPLRYADTFGEMGSYEDDEYYKQAGSPGSDDVAVREYVGNKAQVGWDSATQSVVINGQKIKPNYIDEYGRAHVSKSKIDQLLGGY
jgi:hypothetical protein